MNVHFKNITAAYPSIREEHPVSVLVFKTNLRFKKDIKQLTPVLHAAAGIIRWNVDKEDIDHVLRVETTQLHPKDVIGLVTNAGFFCEELPD